jgi:hypothetical protein
VWRSVTRRTLRATWRCLSTATAAAARSAWALSCTSRAGVGGRQGCRAGSTLPAYRSARPSVARWRGAVQPGTVEWLVAGLACAAPPFPPPHRSLRLPWAGGGAGRRGARGGWGRVRFLYSFCAGAHVVCSVTCGGQAFVLSRCRKYCRHPEENESGVGWGWGWKGMWWGSAEEGAVGGGFGGGEGRGGGSSSSLTVPRCGPRSAGSAMPGTRQCRKRTVCEGSLRTAWVRTHFTTPHAAHVSDRGALPAAGAPLPPKRDPPSGGKPRAEGDASGGSAVRLGDPAVAMTVA